MCTHHVYLELFLLFIILVLLFKNRVLGYKATHDPLTGGLNRAGLHEKTEKRKNKNGIWIIFDLDDFKVINDTYGHEAGDIYLQDFLRFIKSVFNLRRERDFVARPGGDEFLVFLEEISIVKAEHLMKKFYLEMENAFTMYEGHTIPMKACYGMAVASPDKDFTKTINEADDALKIMKAKKNVGR